MENETSEIFFAKSAKEEGGKGVQKIAEKILLSQTRYICGWPLVKVKIGKKPERHAMQTVFSYMKV